VNTTIFSGHYGVDNFAVFFKLVVVAVTALTILISLRYIIVEKINLAEYYSLILFASAGMIILAGGTDLITIYLGLELMSISIYVLAAFIKRDPKSIEAGLKYFLLGAFTSGIVLYGMALVYGMTGTTNLAQIASYLSTQAEPNFPLVLAMILLITGFGFKVSLVPFHMWVPDVYEGAPTSVTAYMAAGTKAAGFAALIRIFMVALPLLQAQWTVLLWLLAVLTMTVGNVVAIAQNSVKRMLAYSSIAHAGYALIGVVAASDIGMTGVLFYLVAYVFMNIGAFSMIILLCKEGDRGDMLEDFTGLARTHPYAAFAFVVFFMSFAGIPPTAGFVGKLYLFAAAIKSGYIWLAVIGVVNSAISVYYYFRVASVMYMREPEGERVVSPSPALHAALAVMVVATVLLGLWPGPFIDGARSAVAALALTGGPPGAGLF
jgi:NADH-quinone oxidoreductase subunit N